MAIKAYRPSEKLKTKFVLYVLIVLTLVFLPWLLLALIPEIGWTFVLIYMGANALWVIVALLLVGPYYRSISYELRDEEMVVRKGILTRTVQTMPYRAVTNVEVKRGPLDRLLGIGGIHVHSAGYSQQTGAEIHFGGLSDWEEVERHIHEAVRRHRMAGPLGEPGSVREEPGAPTGQQAILLSQILDELRHIREVLTHTS